MAIETRPTIAASASFNLTFDAAAGDTIQERLSFPYESSEVESIAVGPIGEKGTGTIKFEKGMNGETNLLAAASFDVATSTSNTLDGVGDFNATQENYQGQSKRCCFD